MTVPALDRKEQGPPPGRTASARSCRGPRVWAGLLPSPPDTDAVGHRGGLRAGGCHFLCPGLGFLLCEMGVLKPVLHSTQGGSDGPVLWALSSQCSECCDGQSVVPFLYVVPALTRSQKGSLLPGPPSSSLPSQPPADMDRCLGWFLLRLVPWKAEGARGLSPAWIRGPECRRRRLFRGSRSLLSRCNSGGQSLNC